MEKLVEEQIKFINESYNDEIDMLQQRIDKLKESVKKIRSGPYYWSKKEDCEIYKKKINMLTSMVRQLRRERELEIESVERMFNISFTTSSDAEQKPTEEATNSEFKEIDIEKLVKDVEEKESGDGPEQGLEDLLRNLFKRL